MPRKLFPITLQGDNSSEIESFPSYLHRISFDHGVYVGELIRFAKHHAPEALNQRHEVKVPNYITVSELVRPEKMTSYLVDLISYATGQKLESSTLWFLGNCLGQSNGHIVRGFRWCPECFAEYKSLGQTPYFKLIWHMKAIKACPIHRTPLIGHCEFCGCDQTTYRKTAQLGICQKCGKYLSIRKHRLRLTDIKFSWEDIGFDIVTLFRDLAKTKPYSLPTDGIHQSVCQTYDFYWRQERENEFYAAGGRDELLALIYKQKPVSLLIARRVAYRLGLALYDLLSGTGAQTTAPLDHTLYCALHPEYLNANKKTKRDHRLVIKKIKAYLNNSDHPPSLNQAANHVGVSKGYLNYRHPVLAQNIVKNHHSYTEHKKFQRLLKAQSCALSYFIDEKYRECEKSRKQAYKTLRAETGLPKFMLKKAIQTAYNAITEA